MVLTLFLLLGVNIYAATIPAGTTGNKKLTANWTPIDYTITYNLNGGTASNPTSYNVETATFALTNPTKEGYIFTGWSGSGSGTSVSIPKGSTGNRTYTANWEAATPQTLTITKVYTEYWASITYTNSSGSTVTETLAKTSYQVAQGTNVKLNGKDGTSRTLYTSNNGGTCTNGTGSKGSSTGCQFTMPASALSLHLHNYDGRYYVRVDSGSVAINVL